MSDETPPAIAAFIRQRDYCILGRAPTTALIVEAAGRALHDGTATGRRVLDWPGDPGADAVPLRLAGGLRALHLSGATTLLSPIYSGDVTDLSAAATIVRSVMEAHDAQLFGWLDGPPQTNEIGRAAALMTGLLAVVAADPAKAVEALEIGSSSGLNLLVDRLGFDLGGTRMGPIGASLVLRPEWRGAPPRPSHPVFAVRPRGVDIQPVDLSDPAQAERLRAFVWADASHRLDRLEAGMDMARRSGVRVDRGDAASWLEERLAEPQAHGSVRVLMHSVVWKYLGRERQERITAAMEAAGARASTAAPLAWVAVEPQEATSSTWVTVRRWPDGPKPRRVARVDLQGDWIEPLVA